jgi:Na+-transporting NADH:ubiquinone oxidoreductase subunit NqrB
VNQRILPNIFSEFYDPRYFQILYLGSFLLYGVVYLAWDVYTAQILTITLSCLITQAIFLKWNNQSMHGLKSAMITALGLCMLLHFSALWVGVLAAFVAIASKFWIRKQGKHIFNPANIGIVAAIALSQQAWVSPGQWGSEPLMWFFIGSAGLMMILKVGVLDTTISFFLTFGGLSFIYVVMYLGWEPQVWMHRMSNGTLLLFAFFMITDPRTTPNHRKARLLFGAAIGLALFVAGHFFYMQSAALWILFLISPLVPLFDKKFKAPVFRWHYAKKIETI